jgi:tetratricopeptide (TPR) repeat protein
MDALLAALSRDPVARRRRSLFVALGAVVMALVGGLAVRAFRQPAVCPSAASELVGLWDDERSTAVHKAFAATGASYAEVAFGSVRRALDAYAAAWVSMRDDACRATRVRGVQSGEALDLRMQCLAQRRQALATAVRLFASADGGTLETAVDTADALPSVWDCANVAALRAPLRLPDDPAKRRRVEEIREELSATDVLASTGRFDDALGRARALVTDAERTDYRPVLAEALLLQGSVMISRREDDAAIGVLDRAVRTAVAGRHESVEAAAWTKMVTAAAWGTRRADGATFADHARAGLERSPDEALHADLEVARGELAQRLGNLDEAIAIEREALAIVERLHGRDSAAAAACLSKLSTSLHKKERDEEALTHARRALSIFEAVRGAGHPSVAVALNNLANDLRGLGRLNEALDAYRRAYAIKVATEGPSSPRTANTLANIGIVLAAQGKVAEAIQDEAQALEIRRRALGNEHTDVALTLENLAEMMLAVRRTDEAVKLADDALSIRTRVQGPDSPFCVVPLVDLALGHADQGDARGALTFAERALTIALAQHAVPEDLASARLAVAVALSGAKTDPARAETLGSQAREVFAAKPALYGTQLARLDALSVHTRR